MYIAFEVHILTGTYQFSLSAATTHTAITWQRGQVGGAAQKLVEADTSQQCEFERVFYNCGTRKWTGMVEWTMEYMMEF